MNGAKRQSCISAARYHDCSIHCCLGNNKEILLVTLYTKMKRNQSWIERTYQVNVIYSNKKTLPILGFNIFNIIDKNNYSISLFSFTESRGGYA